MKKTISRSISIALLSVLFFTAPWQKVQAQDVTVSYQQFYDELSPYGQWVYDPQYGNVWVPNEGGDFRPYGTRGHWVMTDYGNTWVSEDPWGWACYHYGRWTYDPYYGWLWIPGYEWAPAWVSWRFGGGYSGWAPLGPGAGLVFEAPVSWWVFVEPQYMYGNDCYHHWRGPSYNNTYISHTTIINNYYVDNGTRVRYNYGPRPEAIRQVTHRDVTVYHVSQSPRPGAPGISGNRVSIYRPAVNRATVSTARPAGVMNAPRTISSKPHEQRTLAPATQPAFRQVVQSHQQNNGGGTRMAPNGQQPGNRPQPQQQGRPMQQERPQPQQQGRPMQERPQPQQRPQERPMPQQQGRPMQERPQPQERPMPQQQGRPMQERPQPQQRPQPQERPMPQQQGRPIQERPQPQQRPQPQERPMQERPQPQQRPQPQERPMPQQRPQPQERPMPQQRPQPQERPMPQQRPQPQERPQERPMPHEGHR